MKANEENLNRFLGQVDTQFLIPVYQRNYDWTYFHCKQLIDDILRIGDDEKINSHFIGSIVFIHDDVYSTSGLRKLTIIDGQQRITTITLIYIVITMLAKNTKNSRLEQRINQTYLINSFAEEEKLKLRPTENNDKALKYLLLGKDHDFNEFSQLIENFEYLRTRITEENIDVVLKGLNKLLFVEISLERNKDNPQRIFESLNSTGLELSQADLIRNYILMGLDYKHQIKLYEEYWRPIEQYCTEKETNENRVSDFIRDYLTIINREIPNKGRVYQEFKKKFPLIRYDGMKLLLKEIKRFAFSYNKLINPHSEPHPEIRKQLYYVNKMAINVSYPFLLELYNDYENKKFDKTIFIGILELVQSFVWRRFIAGLPSNALNKIFMRLYEDIKPPEYLESVQRSLINRKGNLRFPNDIEIAEHLKDKDVYSIKSKNRMYFLERLENHNNREPVQIEGNQDITIEHIFPQRPDKIWKVELDETEFKDIKEKYLNTIANLTLSGNNGSLSNKSFREKRDLPEKGYRDSRFFLNRQLAEMDRWGINEIEARYRLICDRFFEIWKYPDIPNMDDSNNDEVNIFDADDPTNKKLEYFIFFDQKHIKNKISELYAFIMEWLITEQVKTFFTTDLAEKIELTRNQGNLRQSVPIGQTYYIEANLDSKTKFERIKYALTTFGLTDELFIKYAESGE